MITASDLQQFTGTDYYYKHWLGILYTDGVKFLADQTGANWLLDSIASLQFKAKADPMLADMQFWTLKVNADKSADLICERDTDDEAFRVHIEHTDFPMENVKLWLQNNVLHLPSEY